VVVDGTVVREQRRPTPTGAGPLVDALVELTGALAPFDSVGVGVAGLVTRDGIWRTAPNVAGVSDLAVGGALAARLGRPVTVDNDATCATLAEWRLGAAAGCDEAVVVTLGTGTGAGIVTGGHLARGAHGFAGEVGHMVVDPGGPACVCGRRGCWERYASGPGLARLAREAAMRRGLDGAEGIQGEHVEAAARRGDSDAMTLIDTWSWWVALGLVNLTNLLDPEVIVLGGGLARAADLIMAPVRRHFADLLYAPTQRAHPRLEVALLGERAGAIGAALLPALELGR
jgi:glucokinase